MSAVAIFTAPCPTCASAARWQQNQERGTAMVKPEHFHIDCPACDKDVA